MKPSITITVPKYKSNVYDVFVNFVMNRYEAYPHTLYEMRSSKKAANAKVSFAAFFTVSLKHYLLDAAFCFL